MTYLPRISLPSTYLPITEPDLCFLLALEAAVFALAALSFCRNTKCPEIHACGFILMLEQKRGKALDRTLNGRSRVGFLPTTPSHPVQSPTALYFPHTPQLGSPHLLSRNPLRGGNTEWSAWGLRGYFHRDTGNLQEIKEEDKDTYYIGKYVQSKSSWYFNLHSSLWL